MDHRRFLLTSLAGALATPLAAAAQQTSKVHRIGHVSLMEPDAMAPYVEALRNGLRDLGYVEGQHFVFEHRSAHGNPEKLPVVAAELAQLKVDLILTGINQGVVAARKATTTIPINVAFQAFEVRASSDYEAAFVAISKARADAVVVLSDPLTFPDRVPITRLASKFRVPVVATASGFAEAGGLLSYGPNMIERWRHAAVYVDKVLKGARPSEIPVEQPTRFELVINMKTAKALGLTIPPSVLARADQVVE